MNAPRGGRRRASLFDFSRSSDGLTIASVVSAVGLAMLARLEGRAASQPVNATSHWINGPVAGRVERTDLRHTAVGYGAHHLSALFWALPLEMALGNRRASPTRILASSAVVSAFAGAFDYGVVPKALTPGWEHALPKRSVIAAFGVFAASLALGALATRGILASPERRARDHQPEDGNNGAKRGKPEGEPPSKERVVLGG